MSDSSNQQPNQDEVFDPNSFVRKLSANTKVEILDHLDIQFPSGWKSIIEDLIQSIKAYPIRISQISDTFSVLDIKFEIFKPTKEVNVWRAIEEARNHSVLTCANCGGNKGYRRKLNPSEMLCESCIKNAGQLGKTRTWLDKY